MNTEELLKHINKDDYYEACALLSDKCPAAERRFKRLTKALAELLKKLSRNSRMQITTRHLAGLTSCWVILGRVIEWSRYLPAIIFLWVTGTSKCHVIS